MPATEKNANAFDMTTLSAVNSGYSLMLINNSTNEGQLVTMTDLATMILNEIRNQTFTATELGQAAASTLPAAISSLNSAMIRYKPTSNVISTGDDLNSFVVIGLYSCGTAAVAKTLINCPVNSTFRLDVVHVNPGTTGSIYGFQIINVINSDTFYRRRFSKTSGSSEYNFQSWVNFATNTVV